MPTSKRAAVNIAGIELYVMLNKRTFVRYSKCGFICTSTRTRVRHFRCGYMYFNSHACCYCVFNVFGCFGFYAFGEGGGREERLVNTRRGKWIKKSKLYYRYIARVQKLQFCKVSQTKRMTGVNIERYPIYDPTSAKYQSVVAAARKSLQKTGCAR